MKEPTCPECGEPCNIKWEDMGYGAYEFWGAPGVDVQWVAVSDCCEAALPEEHQKDGPSYEPLDDDVI